MGKISTKEIFDRFFEHNSDNYLKTTRPQIDKPELYSYEEKIGKELIDMNSDDILGLIDEYTNKRKGIEIPYNTVMGSCEQISFIIRTIFNWYIDNVELIRNPFNDKKMKGTNILSYISQKKEPFSFEIVEGIIRKLHRDRDQDNADYIELIMRLYHDGFAKAEEIIQLKEDMIDHKNRCVLFPGKTIHLSDRSYELLQKFHNMDIIETWRGNNLLASWHGSYFKFIIRQTQESKINDRPMSSMCGMINRLLAEQVNNRYNEKINYRNLYFCGFYDYLVKKFGKEKANKIITSHNDSDDIAALIGTAREYGVTVDNLSRFRMYLMPFVKYD